ncbi:hypothetical protein FRC09_020738 [Ceratobasidium sp. 395]|nr:hypothetical protein FRC09_020738 [Ceratobasidium sp. 395]
MPQQIYLTTSTRSSPSPSPPDSPTLIHPHNDLSQNASSQVRRRGRNGVQPGLTPIRPTVDYSTTGSYLGGESTVDNDTTTDGDAYVNPLLGRLGRTSTASTSQLKSTANRPRTDSPDGRNRTLHERRAALPHRRESPHPPSVASRSKGPIALSPRYTCLFPETILIGPLSIDARQAAEHALLNVALLLAAWRLVNTGEVSVAHVLLCIMACSFIYEYGWSVVKLFKSFVMETPSHTKPGSSERVPRRTRIAVTPQRGYVWMTDEKNYRECTDNGETTAALLGPLIAASGLYTSMLPPSSLPFTKSWYMEPALPLLGRGSLNQAQATVGARRALVQCMSLNTLLLFAHMYAANNLRSWPSPENTPHQGRRVVLFVLFSACLTFASLGFYEASKAAGWTFLNEISSFDLICSTFFFQTSLYVMIRMARRAFTLGEVVLVAHGATALFLETVNISIIKQWPKSGSYVRTFREPTPLLVFQLALLPGTLLIGFLLSPLLALSRHIARRPRLRLRAPHQTEQLIYRRMLAIGLAAGTVLLVGGLLGGWVRWLLGGRDPWIWVLRSLTQGRRSWSRFALVAWWGLLGSLSVAGWNRQLARSRRHTLMHTLASAQTPTQTQFKQKPTVLTPLSEVSAVGTYPPLVPRLGTQTPKTEPSSGKPMAFVGQTRDIQAVATDLLDAADKHVPTLSRNGRRKFFHALAVLMFVPGICWDPAFSHLSLSLAFSLFTFAEYIRYFAIYPFGAAVHVFLAEFLDEKDGGTAILSHFYLLTGCAVPLWLESASRVLGLAGVIVLGVGDALLLRSFRAYM